MTPITQFIGAIGAAMGKVDEGLEALAADLDATNELTDDVTNLLMALADVRQAAVLIAFSRGELVPRLEVVKGDLLQGGTR